MDDVKAIKHDWRDIFRAFKMAFDPKKIFLGYAGILASIVWCIVVVTFFSVFKWITTNPCLFIKLFLCSAREGIPVVVSNMLSSIMPLDFGEFFALLAITLGLLAIWAFVGGAITRITALDYARDESVPLFDALQFARKKFWSYFWSPLVPVVGVFFFALCNVTIGLLGRIPVLGGIIVAVGFPFAMISGFLMVFVGVIGAVGLCFMFPTISAEGSDAFDAMSRAYSYILSRPKQFILYCIIYILYGIGCLALVAFAAWLMTRLAFWTVGIGMGHKFSTVQSFIFQKCNIATLGFCTPDTAGAKAVCISAGCSLKFLAGVLIIYIVFIKLAVWTFVTTYMFSAKTIIYFLLRKEIDCTDVSDVYVEEKPTDMGSGKVTEKSSLYKEGDSPDTGSNI